MTIDTKRKNWEATYMKFNEEKLVGIAKKAKELGIELFVLDDGGFSHRDDDAPWIYQGDYQSRLFIVEDV